MAVMEEDHKNPFTLVFVNEQLEAAYADHVFAHMRWRMRVALGVAALLYAAFGLLDPWIVPEATVEVWTIRAVVTAFFGLLYALTFASRFQRFMPAAMSAFTVVAGGGILLMLLLADNRGAQLYYAGLILVMNGSFLMLGTPFVRGVVGCLYIVGAYEAIALARGTPLPILLNNSFFLVGSLVIATFAAYTMEVYARRDFWQTQLIARERAKSESLLLNILPEEIATALKQNRGMIAEHVEEASILFADIVAFAPLTEQMTPAGTVRLLNDLFSAFDLLVEKYGLEKIRTMGDCYMVASGVPRSRADHARALACLALEMRELSEASPALQNGKPPLRIGISTGPVMAGVIGHKKFQYDVWGSTVNVASRMEAQGLPGKIQLTKATYERIRDDFICEPRGTIVVKGIGAMDTWFLVGKKPVGGANRHSYATA